MDDVQGRGDGSGDLVFHCCITLTPGGTQGPCGLMPGSVSLLGIELKLQPARTGSCLLMRQDSWELRAVSAPTT